MEKDMKKRLALFLLATIGLPTATFADFVVNNIKYAPISDTEVKVTGGVPAGSSLTIPETVYDEDEDTEYTVTEIGDNAFALFGSDGARISSSVTLPKTIRRIGDGAFNYQSFSAINLPEGLTYIGEKAFEVNRNLHSVILPSTLKEIGLEAFSRSGLSYVYVLGDTPCKLGTDLFLDISGTDDNQQTVGFHIVVKHSKLAAYTEAWETYKEVITDQVPVTTSGEMPVYAGWGEEPTTGLATYCNSMAIDISGAEGLNAYYIKEVTDNTAIAKLLTAKIIPAGEGVLINGEKGKTYYGYLADDQNVALGEHNCLTGVTKNTPMSPVTDNNKNYVLYDLAFTLFDNSDQWRSYIRKNTAYITVSSNSVTSDTLKVKLEGNASAVNRMAFSGNDKHSVYYRIDGTCTKSPAKGLYIHKGKKIILK